MDRSFPNIVRSLNASIDETDARYLVQLATLAGHPIPWWKRHNLIAVSQLQASERMGNVDGNG